MYKRILVTTDGTVLSRKAVRHAIELAEATGALLFAMTAVPRYPVAYFEGGTAVSSDAVARAERQWAEQGRARVEVIKREAEVRGIKTRAVVSTTDAIADGILACARKHRCDLIVMASHGRRGLKRLLLGSETQKVLTHADIPVLILR